MRVALAGLFVILAACSAGDSTPREPLATTAPAGVAPTSTTSVAAVGQIAFTTFRDGNQEVYVMDANGAGQTNLTNTHTAGDRMMSWSPDGRRIAFLSNRNVFPELWVMDADGSNPKQLTLSLGGGSPLRLVWSPDGTQIAFVARQEENNEVFVIDADLALLDDLEAALDPTNLTNSPADDGSLGLDWSPDGTRIVFTSNRDGFNYHIWVMEADGSNPTNLTSGPAFIDAFLNAGPVWSPDGAQIAFGSETALAFSDVYVIEADGSNPTNLTGRSDSVDSDPIWSPDGSRIAFHSTRDGDTSEEVPELSLFDLYVMEADGSNPVNVTNSPANDTGVTWSPDGTRLAFESERDDNTDVYVVDRDGSNLARLTSDPAYDGGSDWSPAS